MLQAIIFDMDGVLFDTERVAVRSWEKAGCDLGVPGMGSIVPSVLGVSQSASWEVVRKVTGDDFPYDEFRKKVHDYSFAYFDRYGVPVKDGVRIALSYLKENGYKTAVATSTRRVSAMHHFEQTGLTDYLDVFVCGDEVTNSKPAPDIFLTAAKKLGELPESCMVIEDSPNGLKAASAAGTMPVMVPDLVEPDDVLRNLFAYQLVSLAQLPQLLKDLQQ